MVVVSTCDDLVNWLTAWGLDANDVIDKQEGAASIKVTGAGAPPYTTAEWYNPAGTWNWSSYDYIIFWFKTQERDSLKLRIWSGANENLDYIEWEAEFLDQVPAINTWYEVKLYFDSYDNSGGTIDMSIVDALKFYVLETIGGTNFWIDYIRVEAEEDAIKLVIKDKAGVFTDASDDTIEAETWRDSLSGIGRWQAILENVGNTWGGVFLPDERVEIRINGARMMRGYIDDVVPYLEPTGQYKNRIKLIGRDFGMDLAQLYLTAGYAQDNADDIVALAITAAGSEITYASPTAANVIDFEFNRTYLADGIRDICKLDDQDFYVEDNLARQLQFFAVGAANQYLDGNGGRPDIDLTSVPTIATNNILRLEKGEKVGFSIKNKLEAHAGGLQDHWTDLNASDWSSAAAANCTLSDETTIFLPGKGAIRATATGATILIADLIFPKYEYTTLDMSERNEGSYLGWVNYAVPVTKALRIWLKDADDEWIEFYKSKGIAICPECTDDIRNSPATNAWRKVVFPYGEGLEIKGVGTWISGFWQFRPGSGPAFDWSRIEIIRFTSHAALAPPLNVPDYFIVDGLNIPTLEVISIEQDVGSQTDYGVRMLSIYRPDIKNQVELDEYTLNEIPKYADPIESVKITAIGQTGTKYAGQSLDVHAPSHGINALTEYRIVKLHHKIVKSSDESQVAGYIYLTDYDLIKDQINPTQPLEPNRFAIYKTPIEAAVRDMRDKLIRLTKINPVSSSGGAGGGAGGAGTVPYYIDGADIVWYDTGPAYAMLRPETTGAIDLGSNAIKWGDIWGIVHYSDLYMSDLECPLCGERFKPEDALNLTVREVIKKENELGEEYEEIRCVPSHKRCPLLARIKKWIKKLYRGK